MNPVSSSDAKVAQRLDGLLDIFADIFRLVEAGFLRQVPHGKTLADPGFAVKILVDAAHDLAVFRLLLGRLGQGSEGLLDIRVIEGTGALRERGSAPK